MLIGIGWYLIVILSCTYLMISCTYLMILWVSCVLFAVLHHVWWSVFTFCPFFLTGLFSYYWVLKICCMFWLKILFQTWALQVFLPVCDLSLHSPSSLLKRSLFCFNFYNISFINMFFFELRLVLYLSYLCLNKANKDCLLFLCRKFFSSRFYV